LRDRSKTTAQQTSALDLMRDIKRLNDHLVAGAAYPVLEATGDLMPSRIAEDSGDGGSDWPGSSAISGNRFAGRCGNPLCERRDELLEPSELVR
jgi:hypothetical protein